MLRCRNLKSSAAMMSSIPLNVFGKGKFEETIQFNACFVRPEMDWLIRDFKENRIESTGLYVVICNMCNPYIVRIDTCISLWCCVCLCPCCDVLKIVRVR